MSPSLDESSLAAAIGINQMDSALTAVASVLGFHKSSRLPARTRTRGAQVTPARDEADEAELGVDAGWTPPEAPADAGGPAKPEALVFHKSSSKEAPAKTAVPSIAEGSELEEHGHAAPEAAEPEAAEPEATAVDPAFEFHKSSSRSGTGSGGLSVLPAPDADGV